MKNLVIVCVLISGVAWVSSAPVSDALAATSPKQPPPAVNKWSWPWSISIANAGQQTLATTGGWKPLPAASKVSVPTLGTGGGQGDPQIS